MSMENVFGGVGIFFIFMMAVSARMFLLVAGVIIFVIVRMVKNNRRDDRSPRLTVPATVVTKRTHISHHRLDNSQMMDSVSTTYYATFQVESGDRMEMAVSATDYGWLAEGDRGQLTFQGSRFVGFERI